MFKSLKIPLSETVSKNTLYLFSAQLISKAIAFFYAVILARALGPSDFGLYIYVLTIFGLTAQVADFGFNRFLIRDVARDKSNLTFYLSNIFTFRLLLMLATVILVAAAVLIFDPNISRSALSVLALLTILPNAGALTLEAAFVATEKMKYPAAALIFLNFSVAALGILALFGFNAGILGVILTFLAAHLLYLLMYGFFLIKENIKFSFNFDFNFWKKSALASFPYGILAVLGLVYFKIDAVLLTLIRGEVETGFYGAAFKFLEGVHFVPLVFGTALFPVMARLHDDSILKLKSIYFSTLRILFVVSLAIFIFLIVTAPFLVKFLYGPEFTPSVLILQILSITILFMFLHVPGAHLLFATDKYLRQVVLLSIFTVSFNIFTNLIFIPKYGMLGAAAVTVASEALSFFVFFLFIIKVVFGERHEASSNNYPKP